MKKSNSMFLGVSALAGIVAVSGIALTGSKVQAEEEIRAGAVLQIPFGGSGNSFFDYTSIRFGASAQYAEVEENEITITRYIEKKYVDGKLKSENVIGETSEIDEGDEVYGAQFNVFVQPFGDWTPSVELVGFYGSNDIQGALGGGYDWENGVFGSLKAMFPYSEIGLRLTAPVNISEVYVGATTFGKFDPESNTAVNEVVHTVTISSPKDTTEVSTDTSTPVEEEGGTGFNFPFEF